MRWKTTKMGDIRTRRKFALFPICGENTTIWLEWVTITEEADRYGTWVMRSLTLEDKF